MWHRVRKPSLALVGVMLVGVVASSSAAHAALPDGRVYEQVSPPDKGAADVIPRASQVRVSRDGNRAIFSSLVGFGDVQGISGSTEYFSMRDPASGHWRTHGISPPQDVTGYFPLLNSREPRYVVVSSDLERGVVRTRSPLTDAPNVAGAFNLYMRSELDAPGKAAYSLLTDAVDPQSISVNGAFLTPEIAGASDDISRVIFESRRALTPAVALCNDSSADATCPPVLYESVNGELRMVAVLPASEGGGLAPRSQAGQGALRLGPTAGSISKDGSRIVFTVPTGVSSAEGALYIRDDQKTLDLSDDVSIRVNETERVPPDPSGEQPASYWAASSDGSKVFFTTSEKLTSDDPNSSNDLYRFDLNAATGEKLTRLSVDAEPSDNQGSDVAIGHDVAGVIGISENGAYVYFVVTQGQLVAGGPTGATGGPIGGERIFVWHDGVVRQVGAINTLVELEGVLGTAIGLPQTARVSPDGSHLLFITEGTDELLSLYGTAEYNHGTTCPSKTFVECDEAYLYEADANGGAGDLQCVSCNPSGARATTDASLNSGLAGLGTSAATTYLNHPLSDNGRYVFFNTAERLQPEDRNNVTDVYEYDSETGYLHLLSSGRGSDHSTFLDASLDGSDVLFTTRDRLRSSDTDEARDLYDARIGGVPDPGLVNIVPCEGDECRETPSLNSGPSASPSEAPSSVGDLAARSVSGRLSVRDLSQAQRKQLVRRGVVGIVVRAPRSGVLSLQVIVRSRGRSPMVQIKKRTLKGRGSVRIPLHLPKLARERLARGATVVLTVKARYVGGKSARPIRIVLQRANSGSTHA